MKQKFLTLLVILCALLITGKSFATTYYTYINGGSSGFWNVPGTWTTDPSGLSLIGSAVPGNTDDVFILNGFTVLVNANITASDLSITINNGGTLDLATFTTANLQVLAGSGTLRIKSGYFPAVTTNTFLANSNSTVEYYDFTGTLPVPINYPNLTFRNTTAVNHSITFTNSVASSFTISGNLVTVASGTGALNVIFGTHITNVLSLTVNRNVTVGANTTLGVGVFDAIHSVTIRGNLTNNGRIDFSNGAQYSASTTGAANLTFSGATDNTMACNGPTDLYVLTIDKGAGSTNILSVTSTNTAHLNFYSNGQLIVISYGTLRLGANITIPRVFGGGTGNYDVGSSSRSPMLWVDGATVNTNGHALVVYGKFRITSGSFTSMGGEGTVIREEGQYIIEGGIFTTEKFRPSTTAATHRGSFTMTGGEFNANGVSASNSGYARFSLPYPEQVFIMSGGTINVRNPQSGGTANHGGIHIGCNPSN